VGELGGDAGAEEVTVGEVGLEDGQFFHAAGGVGFRGVVGRVAEVLDIGVEVVANDGFFDVALRFDDELDEDLCILLAYEGARCKSTYLAYRQSASHPRQPQLLVRLRVL